MIMAEKVTLAKPFHSMQRCIFISVYFLFVLTFIEMTVNGRRKKKNDLKLRKEKKLNENACHA